MRQNVKWFEQIKPQALREIIIIKMQKISSAITFIALTAISASGVSLGTQEEVCEYNSETGKWMTGAGSSWVDKINCE